LTAALVASGRLFGRESTAALKWSALRKRGVTATRVRGVVNPLEDSRQWLLSTNPAGAYTLRPPSMLNLIRRLSINVSRTGTIRKAAFIRAEEACDILADISDRQVRSQLEQARWTSQKAMRTMFRSKFFLLMSTWLDYSKVCATLN
jgi:hypothetical protein